jgi:hypothetical protein
MTPEEILLTAFDDELEKLAGLPRALRDGKVTNAYAIDRGLAAEAGRLARRQPNRREGLIRMGVFKKGKAAGRLEERKLARFDQHLRNRKRALGTYGAPPVRHKPGSVGKTYRANTRLYREAVRLKNRDRVSRHVDKALAASKGRTKLQKLVDRLRRK